MILHIIGSIATCLLFLPVIIILVLRLYNNPSLLFISVYYLLTAAYNFMQLGLINVSANIKQSFGVIINYADAPLMLLVLLFFCNTKKLKRGVYFTIIAFVIYEVVIGFIYGLSVQSSVFTLGPGIAVLLLFSTSFFLKNLKFTIVLGKAVGRTLMISAILFSYLFFALIYFFYYIQKTPAVADVFLIYFIVSIISCICMSIGLYNIYKRARELKEVQITRRELSMFFNN